MKLKNVIEGMQIIARHTPNERCVAAEHDIIYCGDAGLPLTEDEKAKMESLGWFTKDDSWAFFP